MAETREFKIETGSEEFLFQIEEDGVLWVGVGPVDERRWIPWNEFSEAHDFGASHFNLELGGD